VGVRQWLSQNRKLALAIVAGTIILTVASASLIWRGSDRSGASASGPGQAFFSIDDGKTWFADDVKKLPPFETDGKQTLLAYVYKCADGKSFVACLARYTPQTRAQLAAIYARGGNQPDPLILRQLETEGLEVKRPGQSTWLKRSDPRAAELTMPRCPDGSYAQPVLP
jgi:hypothetical protein